MNRLSKEIGFIIQLIKLNLASNMEYRASFLTQFFGMFINDGIYFVFWLLFFDRFKEIRGYSIAQIYLLFAVVTFGYGIALTLAGNCSQVAEYIAKGRLDYYLTLPRPVLPHLLFNRIDPFAMGDLSFGILAYLFTGRFDPVSILLFIICSIFSAMIFVSFFTVIGSLAFFIGNANELTLQMFGAMITFSIYPNGLFQGAVRLILLTILPAAFVGAVPVEVVENKDPMLLLGLGGAALTAVAIMVTVFHIGLRRYESGSAINVNM